MFCMNNMDWYNALNKPFLTPPAWLFGVVWPILYILMAVSLIIFISSGLNKKKILPLILFFVQLGLNLLWSPIFFDYQDILVALIVIVTLWLLVLFTLLAFYRHSKIAGLLLLPYLLWITFATYLNIGFWVLN